MENLDAQETLAALGAELVDAPHPDTGAERNAAAAVLRRLGHAFVAHEVDSQSLLAITASLEQVLGSIEQGKPRNRPIEYMKKHMFDSVPDDGMPMRHFPDCIVSGLGNPMGVAINTRRDGDEAVAQVVIDAAFKGAPGRAHGGIVAAIFDDVMGYVLSILRTPAYTGRLSISYRAPTPMHSELEFRGWLHHRSGRKLLLRSRATHGSTVIAEAEGLFISIPLERFGIRPGGAGS